MNKRLLLAVLLLPLTVLLGAGLYDDDPMDTLLARLATFRTSYPQEKIHLHLDKPAYTVGDTIWFKAYLVNSELNRPSTLSKILYVDLINERDSLKRSLRLQVDSGAAWGDFVLGDTLREGNYRIRAYTKWMRNFGEEYFFDQTIVIGNALANDVMTTADFAYSKSGNYEQVKATLRYTDLDGRPLANKPVTYEAELEFRPAGKGAGTTDDQGKLEVSFVNTRPFLQKSGKLTTHIQVDDTHSVYKSIPVTATSDDVSLQFFPEGGQLVDSIRSTLGVKAVGASGLGVPVSGLVTDPSGNRVAEFQSEHAGMGAFQLTPLPGRSYTATVKFADGSTKTVPLPAALKEGVVISISPRDTATLSVRISASRNIADKGELLLVAQSGQIPYFVSKVRPVNGTALVSVPRSRFPMGIAQFTVFSADNEPLAERLIFVRNNDQLSIAAATDRPVYAKRSKVTLTIGVAANGRSSTADCSLSVIRSNTSLMDEGQETSIFSSFFLRGDLAGYVEQPGYYFLNPGPEKDRQLDHLMLTQGWRKFSWKNILANAFPSINFPAETSMTLAGTMTTLRGKPITNGKVDLFSTSGDGLIIDTVTNAEGRFVFDHLSFNENTAFVIQGTDEAGKRNVSVELDRSPTQLVTRNKNSADVNVNFTRAVLPYLQSRKADFDELRLGGQFRSTILLKEVKVKQVNSKVSNSRNLNGAGRADVVITADALANAISLPQFLQGRVAGLVIQNGIAYLTRNMGFSMAGRSYPMQIVVDGVNFDPSFLGTIPPSDVDAIEVLKSAGTTAIYGSDGYGGVLLITTKRGRRNISPEKYAPGLVTFSPQGYAISREFYSPDYSVTTPLPSEPDLRSTVYWNPRLRIPASGHAEISFYTPDKAGTYRMVIEGLSEAGKPGRQVIYFNVNE